MSRRIEVELTSQRDDGTWTWRAAGAKQPKGELDGGLLYDGVAVGDVVRADADFEIDGIFVTKVMPPKGRSGRPDDERLELLDTGRDFEGVTTQLAKGRRRDDGDGRGRGRGRGRGDRNGEGRGDRDGGRGRGRGDRDGGRGNRGDRGDRGDRGRGRGERDDRRPRRDGDDAPARARPKKLRPGRAHRSALIASLPDEQRVVAETVARGGIAAVRKEIETQNSRAASEGGPEVKADALIGLAEALLPQIKVAEWRDRADAALAGVDEVDIRDLRTVLVAAEDSARDDEARAVAEQLREALNARVERAQSEWHDELRSTLEEGRVVRALRLSSRPPKAGAPLPPDIAEKLTAEANEALTGEVTQQRLGIVLEAVAYSPVRPYIVLLNVPENPGEELLESIRKVSDRIPEIATRLGVDPKERRRGRGRGRGKGKPKVPAPPSADGEGEGPKGEAAEAEAPSEATAPPAEAATSDKTESTDAEVAPEAAVADSGEPTTADDEAASAAGPDAEADAEVEAVAEAAGDGSAEAAAAEADETAEGQAT